MDRYQKSSPVGVYDSPMGREMADMERLARDILTKSLAADPQSFENWLDL